MKVFFFSITLSIICLSCATSKWKAKYIDSRYLSFMAKYGNNADLNFDEKNLKFSKKSYYNLTRKDVKKNLKIVERSFALMPDSTSGSLSIDSFYSNTNKIKYIKNQKLNRNTIHIIGTK